MPLTPPQSKRAVIAMMRALHMAEIHELAEHADTQLFDAVFSLPPSCDTSVIDHIVELARKQGGTAELEPDGRPKTIRLADVLQRSYIHGGLSGACTKWMEPYLY